MEIMELENTIQNLPHGLNSRVEMTEDKISKVEDWSIEFTISDEKAYMVSASSPSPLAFNLVITVLNLNLWLE